jgi:hypothetical protein
MAQQMNVKRRYAMSHSVIKPTPWTKPFALKAEQIK